MVRVLKNPLPELRLTTVALTRYAEKSNCNNFSGLTYESIFHEFFPEYKVRLTSRTLPHFCSSLIQQKTSNPKTKTNTKQKIM